MGYTHYWTFKKPAKGQAQKVEIAYQKAVKKCQKLIYDYNKAVEYDDCRLSGYTAHVKPGQYGGVKVNGKGSESHEDFVLREHYSQNLESSYWGFCKTARKSYDEVVVACLTILKHYLKDNIEVSSDGDVSDWLQGVYVANKYTKLTGLKVPKGVDNAENYSANLKCDACGAIRTSY